MVVRILAEFVNSRKKLDSLACGSVNRVTGYGIPTVAVCITLQISWNVRGPGIEPRRYQ